MGMGTGTGFLELDGMNLLFCDNYHFIHIASVSRGVLDAILTFVCSVLLGLQFYKFSLSCFQITLEWEQNGYGNVENFYHGVGMGMAVWDLEEWRKSHSRTPPYSL